MYYKVDYFSFTAELPGNMKFSTEDPQVIATALALSSLGGEICPLVVNDIWEIYKGGRIYVWRCQQPDSGLSLSFDVAKPYFTIEFGGSACDFIRDCDLLDIILKLGQPRCTRIDLAVDIDTDDRPIDFLRNGYNSTIKSHSDIISEAGETKYVGSWNSERFARVYKYNHPNPRSHLLRVEHVHKGDWAKAYALACVEHGVAAACVAAGTHYQWSSNLWDTSALEIPVVRNPRITPSQAGKYLWLVKQVAPAIRKAREEGWFDLDAWLRTNVYKSPNDE